MAYTSNGLLDDQHNEFSARVKNQTYEGPGWTLYSTIRYQTVISEIASCEGRFYFPFPKELHNSTRGLINIVNADNVCFRWLLVKILTSANKNQVKIINDERKFAKKTYFKGAKFPVHKKCYAKIEKQINISMNTLEYNNKTPYCIYTLKNFWKSMGIIKTSHHGRKCLYGYCLKYFSSSKVLESH